MTLPNALIIGAGRSGTTSLFNSLAVHPQIFTPLMKEVNFFMRAPDGSLPPWTRNPGPIPQTLADYEALFADAGPQHRVVLEASPSYLWGPTAIWIRHRLPDVKLVAILRQPVDQAFSILTTWLGRPPSLEELKDRLHADKLPGPKGAFPLVDHGRYYGHLLPFFEDAFGEERFPRKQIKVILFDDLEDNPQALLADLQGFLGVDVVELPVRKDNPSGLPKNAAVAQVMRARRLAHKILPSWAMRKIKPVAHRIKTANTQRAESVPAGLRAEWTEQFYGESIDQLQDLIGRDLSQWRREPPSVADCDAAGDANLRRRIGA